LGTYIIYGGGFAFFLIVAYEYGWPPIELLAGWLRSERSRRIATVVGWVLTGAVLIIAGWRLWFTVKDVWAGVGLMR
jgi:hypothetical protein